MWFRVIMLLAMIKGDNIEGALSNIGYVMLSSSLHSGFQLVQGKIMLPKLVKMGKVHPEALRKAKFPMRRMLWHFFVASFVAYLLVQSGSKRLTWFLLVTTGVFPIFRCFAFPKMWPIPAFMCLVMYFVWRNEGVQELFLGLLLFQAVPVMQEIMTFYLQPVVGRMLARVGAFAAWYWTFFERLQHGAPELVQLVVRRAPAAAAAAAEATPFVSLPSTPLVEKKTEFDL